MAAATKAAVDIGVPSAGKRGRRLSKKSAASTSGANPSADLVAVEPSENSTLRPTWEELTANPDAYQAPESTKTLTWDEFIRDPSDNREPRGKRARLAVPEPAANLGKSQPASSSLKRLPIRDSWSAGDLQVALEMLESRPQQLASLTFEFPTLPKLSDANRKVFEQELLDQFRHHGASEKAVNELRVDPPDPQRPYAAAIVSGPHWAMAEIRKTLGRTIIVMHHAAAEECTSILHAALKSASVAGADADTRLYAARCLAEGLRIFWPEPPLSQEMLRLTLTLHIQEIGQLATSAVDSQDFEDRLSLLMMVDKLHSLKLVEECGEASDGLMVDLVEMCLNVSEKRKHTDVSQYLLSALSNVLRDMDNLPYGAVRALVVQMTPDVKDGFVREFIRRLLIGVNSRLSDLGVSLKFSEFLNAELYGKRDKKLNKADTANLLRDLFGAIEELYSIDPVLVWRVLPCLKGDIDSTDADRRLAATSLIGRLLASHPPEGVLATSRPHLVCTHPGLFESFVQRMADADKKIRLAALGGAYEIFKAACRLRARGLVSQGDQLRPTNIVAAAEFLTAQLKSRCSDPYDEVRLRTIQIVADIATSTADGVGYVLMAPIMEDIFWRVTDKKAKVREEGVASAAGVYSINATRELMRGSHRFVEVMAWAPQQVFNAYSYFQQHRAGYAAEIEELIDSDILCCQNPDLSAQERALLFLGFYSAARADVTCHETFLTLLQRKCDVRTMLWRYIQLRCQNARPTLDTSVTAGALVFAPKKTDDAVASRGSAILDSLAAASPLMEVPQPQIEVARAPLEALDSSRNLEVWESLKRLCGQVPMQSTAELVPLWEEVEGWVKREKLNDLVPLLRRGSVITWLLPDQLEVFLRLWRGEVLEGMSPESSEYFRTVVRSAMEELPKHLPHAFLPHVGKLAEHLRDEAADDVCLALCSLATLSKPTSLERLNERYFPVAEPLQREPFLDALLRAIRKLARTPDVDLGSLCRKAVRALRLLPKDDIRLAIEDTLLEAEAMQDDRSSDQVAVVSGLHLAAACFEQMHKANGFGDDRKRSVAEQAWKKRVGSMLQDIDSVDVAGVCAAIDARMAVDVKAALSLLTDLERCSAQISSHAVVAVLRAIRRGTLPLCASLMSSLANQIMDNLAPPIPVAENLPALQAPAAVLEPAALPDKALGVALAADASVDIAQDVRSKSLVEAAASAPVTARAAKHDDAARCGVGQKLLDAISRAYKQPIDLASEAAASNLADRVRLSTSLPALFARAPERQQRDAALRVLKLSLKRVLRWASVRREPLIEVAVACFVHMLSRLDVLVAEANAPTSKFEESSRIAAFFIDALLKCDSSLPLNQVTELAAAAFRVCERAKYFVDREQPKSDHINKAVWVLRYVLEKRCPDVGSSVAASSREQSANSAFLAKLFAVRPGVGKATLAPIAAPATGYSPAPLPSSSPSSAQLVAGASTPPSEAPKATGSSAKRQRSSDKSPIPSIGRVRGSGRGRSSFANSKESEPAVTSVATPLSAAKRSKPDAADDVGRQTSSPHERAARPSPGAAAGASSVAAATPKVRPSKWHMETSRKRW